MCNYAFTMHNCKSFLSHSLAIVTFHSDCDGCFVSLGGVELAVFSGPLDADVEARLNGESLWGRHFYFQPSPSPVSLGVLSY